MGKRSVFLVLAVSICLWLCTISASARTHSKFTTSHSLAPTQLRLSIGGFLGPSYLVEWNGYCLAYTVSSGGHLLQEHTIIPSNKDWQRFWQDADAVRLWKWRSQYNCNPKVQDGTQWHFLVQQSGKHAKRVHVAGSNCYPSDRDVTIPDAHGEPSKIFLNYLAAIRRLIGNKAFH